jgi:hypothetical protein
MQLTEKLNWVELLTRRLGSIIDASQEVHHRRIEFHRHGLHGLALLRLWGFPN